MRFTVDTMHSTLDAVITGNPEYDGSCAANPQLCVKGNLEIENGSKVVAASTSSSAIRGGSYNMILLDEFAFVPPNIADEFMSSVYPTISSGTSTKIVVVSTPNGLNHFYKMWEDAKEKNNNYVPLEVHWTDVPGRDNLWKNETIRNIGKERWAQEFEGEFIGGLNTLISGSTLKNMVFKNPVETNNGLDIYELPKEDHMYICLLYTSPSPRDATLSRIPACA